MSRRKHYVFVGDDSIAVKPMTSQERDLQVAYDLDLCVTIEGYELRNGAMALFASEDRGGLYEIDLEVPRMARTLVAMGALNHQPMDWDVRGGLWIFGPGRGWSRDEAEEEAERLRRLVSE